MTVELYTHSVYSQLSELQRLSSGTVSMAQRYLLPLLSDGVPDYVSNLRTELRLLRVGDAILPLTINDGQWDNALSCSPYSQYISYAYDELQQIPSALFSTAIRALLAPLGGIFRWGELNRVVCVNNWLFSTNLYPDLTFSELRDVIAFLKEIFPSHALVFRSVTPIQDSQVSAALTELGALLVPSRQVYLSDSSDPRIFQARMVKSDQALRDKSPYRLLRGSEIPLDQAPRIAELYSLLNIEKYSRFNPAYTAKFVELALRERFLDFFALEHNGRIDAVMASYRRGNVLTSPFFGYDTQVAQDLGLYRQISLLLLEEAQSKGLLLNHSAGAGGFKRLRRAKPAIEYLGVVTEHLPFARQATWRLLRRLLLSVGVPLMKRYRL